MDKRCFFKTGMSNFLKKLNLLLLIVVICSSCGCNIVPQYIKQDFNYCYDGIDTGIDSLINIEGYYVLSDENDFPSRLMFYRDGIYVDGFILSNPLQLQFEKMINKPNKLKLFHRDNRWGRGIRLLIEMPLLRFIHFIIRKII